MVTVYENNEDKNKDVLSSNSNEAKVEEVERVMSSNDELNTLLASKTDAVSSVKVSSANEREDNISKPGNSLKHGTLSSYVETFLNNLQLSINKNMPYGSEGNLKVSEVLGGLARLYERIRTTVEYKGEHVLRRNAIERILKRLIWEKGNLISDANVDKLSENLIKELIWARYLKNDSIAKVKISQVSRAINKYLFFLENLDNLPKGVSITQIRNWIWGIASSEIEETVDPSNRELYVVLMNEWFNSNYNWISNSIPKHEREVQIYLAIHRSFTKSDEAVMRYHLLRKEFTNWDNATKDEVYQLINIFPKIHQEIEDHINFSGRMLLFRRMQKHSSAFEIFRAITQSEVKNLGKLLSNRKLFDEKIKEVCEGKYKQIKNKVNTGIIRSVIYIFISKVFLALIIEIPYEIFRFGDIRYIPLFINIGFPPFLMWIIGMSIAIPGAKNTQLIIDKLNSVVYSNESNSKVVFSTERSRSNNILLTAFSAIYALLFILVFGGISYILLGLNFSFFGIIIFFIFISLVLLFIYRVRFNATQLRVNKEDEGLFDHIFSYITLPFLNFGYLISAGLSKLNFLTILLDFIIEAPLKSIIEIFEEWSSYIKEKKEEVIEIPE